MTETETSRVQARLDANEAEITRLRIEVATEREKNEHLLEVLAEANAELACYEFDATGESYNNLRINAALSAKDA